jgi:hypothetical protein
VDDTSLALLSVRYDVSTPETAGGTIALFEEAAFRARQSDHSSE